MRFGEVHLCYKCKNKPKDIGGTTVDVNSCRFALSIWLDDYNDNGKYQYISTANSQNDTNSGQYIGENGEIILERQDNGAGYWITKCKKFSPDTITNGEKLRAMPDEELASWIAKISPFGTQETWKKWLSCESFTEANNV